MSTAPGGTGGSRFGGASGWIRHRRWRGATASIESEDWLSVAKPDRGRSNRVTPATAVVADEHATVTTRGPGADTDHLRSDREAGSAPKSDNQAQGTEDLHRLLFEQTSSAVVVGETVCDAAGKLVDYRIVDVNPAFVRLTGQRADQVVGRRASKVLPALRQGLIERLGRVASSGQPGDFEGHDAATDRYVHIRISRVGPTRLMAMIEDVTNARSAEAALRERNAFVETIIASSGDGVVVYGRDLRVTVWNPAMEEALGLTADQVLGRRPSEAYPEAVATGLEEVLAAVMETGESQWREFELTNARSGRRGWARALYRPHRDTSGQIVGIVASIRDITSKHEGEEFLREQARFVQELLEAIPSPIVAKDREGRVTLCNTAYAVGNFGLQPEEVIGKTNRELGQPEAALHAEHDRNAIERGALEIYEADRFLADGTTRRHIVTKAPLRSKNGEITGTVTADQDITEIRAAEQASRQSEERFRTLFDFASDAIFIHDVGGRFVEVNRTACERLGYSRDELLAMSPVDIDAPEYAALVSEREQALATQNPTFFETAHVRKDGTVVPVQVSATIIELGGRKAILSIARDISEWKRAEAERMALEEQLRESQKMESIGRLAGGIAHDFNNLLTAIRGSASLALAELPPGEGPREDLEQIEQAADRAAGLTRQLLAFARRTVLQPEVVDLGEIVGRLEPMLSRLIGEDVSLTTVVPGGSRCILADPGQIEQVILNLAVNASDAMPDGGRLTIEVGDIEPTIAAESPGQALPVGPMTSLSVTDTGVGMSDETLEHLFEPFFTTKGPGKGTGLGLATVYGIVRMSGGTITVRSDVDRGSTVTVYLPLVEAARQTSSEPRHETATGSVRTGTILVVEDDAGVRRFASRVLESAGYRVLTSSDGASAIEASRAAPVQLLLTDMVMPGMNGRDVALKLAATQPGIRVLYMSGHTDKGIVRDGVLEPDIDFLAKPFTAAALLEAVDRAIGAASTT
jgi:PAS domain S-box-containing protein